MSKTPKTVKNTMDSTESIYLSSSEDEDCDFQKSLELTEIDKFLLGLPEFDYVTRIKLYELMFKGTFEYYSDILAMSTSEKVVVKELFRENIFQESFGTSVIKMTSGNDTFLLQPHAWNLVEMERDLLRNAYHEVCFRLGKPDMTRGLKGNDILFRFGVPLGYGFIFTVDYIFDESINGVNVKFHYRNANTEHNDSDCTSCSFIAPAWSFVDFIGYGPFIGVLTANNCMAENIKNASELPDSQKFGNEVMTFLTEGRTSVLETIKNEYIVRRVYNC